MSSKRINKKQINFKTPMVILLTLVGLSAMSLLSQEQINSNMPAKAKEGTLKGVMQGLLEANLRLNEAIILQDLEKIEQAAHNIANHPKPGMATKMKLVGSFGSEMAEFKKLDTVVHDKAVAIEKAAAEKDMKAVLANYHEMLDGCQACHVEFKARVQEILK